MVRGLAFKRYRFWRLFDLTENKWFASGKHVLFRVGMRRGSGVIGCLRGRRSW